jgi:di- and tripeptidase
LQHPPSNNFWCKKAPTMSAHSRNRSGRPLNAPNLGVPSPIEAPTKSAPPKPGLTMSITHRLNTSGSVQALTILDNECLIAGLQGGRILVSCCCPFTSLPRRGGQSGGTDDRGQAWSLSTYQLLLSVQAHQEGVVSLYISDDGQLLFSGGADSVINVRARNEPFSLLILSDNDQVWSTDDFQRLYSIHSAEDVGDIFSIVYSSGLETIFCGAQDQSIQVGPYLPSSLTSLTK